MTDVTPAAPVADPVGEGHGATHHDAAQHGAAHHGPTDRYYVRIAVALALITALEVAWSYLPVWKDASGLKSFVEVGGLLVMMAVKFVVVASNFMHLKFDDKVLTRVFYAGLILAISVYVAALVTFELFGGGTPGYT